MPGQLKISEPLFFFALFTIGFSLATGRYFDFILIAVLLLLVLYQLFWTDRVPSVILFGIGFQWLTITAGVLYSLFSGYDYLKLTRFSDYIPRTFYLSIIGLLFFSLGAKVALINIKIQSFDVIKAGLKNYDTKKIIYFYIAWSILGGVMVDISREYISGLSQPILWLTNLKWGLFLFMIINSFVKNENKNFVIYIIIGEVVLGFTGYFSVFKDFIIFFVISYLTFNKLHGAKQYIVLVILSFAAINLAIIWTFIKDDYRHFLSGGEGGQQVVVSKQDALEKFWDLSSKIDENGYNVGTRALVKRIYYIEYFAATVRYVPTYKPYQDGDIWKGAIEHILKPRILFPDKKVLDDSEQTNKYTGLSVSGASKGVSISLGYMAESYADFGPDFMFVPIFFLGLLLGLIYRYFITSSGSQLWGYAMVMPMYNLFNINGLNSNKIMGNVFMYLIVFYLFKRFVIPVFDKLIRKTNEKKHS